MKSKCLMLVFMMILCLAPPGGWAEAPEDAPIIELPSSKDGVEAFMAAFAPAYPNGIIHGYHEEEARCYNVTPDRVARETDIRIFKFSDSAASYAFVDGAVYDLCESTGGYGFLNAVPWDYDRDGLMDLLTASSCGSGISRAEISVFSRVWKTSKVIYSTLYEDDPQVDLIVFREDPPLSAGADPTVTIRQVQVLPPEDGDFVHLRCRDVGEYRTAAPLILHEVEWDGAAAASLLGAWYCEPDEDGAGVVPGIAMIFADDGTLTLRLMDPVSCQYKQENTARYRVSGDCLILEADRETTACPFTIMEGGLRIAMYGMEQMVFRKLSGEELDRIRLAEPKYRPGEVSGAAIDYGSSERFTREQMDRAMAVIKDRFRTWYGCELRSIAYTSDERSAEGYRRYARRESQRTGQNYIDGIVFVSSFHTPPEEREDPGSGFNPDDEYTGWEWILLLSGAGEWELADWGY